MLVRNPDNSVKQTVQYRYDGLGRRTQKIVDGIVTSFVYDKEDVIAEFEGGSLAAMYVHGPGIDDPIAIVRDINKNGGFDDNEVFFYSKDHLGSTHALTNNLGG